MSAKPNERPTPITDEAILKYEHPAWPNGRKHTVNHKDVVYADHARDLERQLAEASEQIAELETRHAATMLHTQAIVNDANSLREQRDRLAEAADALISAKGRHDTKIAYDGLQIALAIVKGGNP